MAYNGYKNYETWAVALHISNDEKLYNRWRALAGSLQAAAAATTVVFAQREVVVYDLADQLRDALRESAAEQELSGRYSGIMSDLLMAGLSEVDWNEVAESLLDDEE